MRPLRIFWGLLILIVGFVFLAVNANLIAFNTWGNFILYWPVLIVLFGLGLVLRNSIVYLITAVVIIATTFYFAIADPYHWQNKEENNAQIISPNLVENYDPSINKFVLSLDLGALKFHVRDLNDPNSLTLIKGTYSGISHFSEDRTNDGKVATLSVKEEDQKNLVFDSSIKDRAMDLQVTNQLPLDFTINSGASLLDMDFSNLQLQKLNINTGMSSINVKLGDLTDSIDANVKCGASAVTFTIPKDYGVKIISSTMLVGRNFGDLDMDQQGNEYATKGFDESKKKLTINLSSGISELSIHTY